MFEGCPICGTPLVANRRSGGVWADSDVGGTTFRCRRCHRRRLSRQWRRRVSWESSRATDGWGTNQSVRLGSVAAFRAGTGPAATRRFFPG
jgi:hypothetical protein